MPNVLLIVKMSRLVAEHKSGLVGKYHGRCEQLFFGLFWDLVNTLWADIAYLSPWLQIHMSTSREALGTVLSIS